MLLIRIEFNFLFSDQNCNEAKDGDQIIGKCSKSNDEDSPPRENGSDKLKICQNSAKNDENIQTDRCNEPEKVESESVAQENVTFDALENTKVAMAQFAAAALSKGNSANSAKDLTVLQSALFTLQHQQVFQMQLIEQLQYQLAKNSMKRDKKPADISHDQKKDESEKGNKNQVDASEDAVEDDVFVKNSDER